MRPPVSHLLSLAGVVGLMLLSIGCCPCPPDGCCPGGQCPPVVDCPGGVCPTPFDRPAPAVDDAMFDELTRIGAAPEVNREALNEPKGQQPCLPCQQRPQYRPPAVWIQPAPPARIQPARTPARIQPQLSAPQPRPAATPAYVTAAKQLAARSETKTGAYCCSKCKRPTVGRDWKTIYTERGDVATFLCHQCWNRSTEPERQSQLAAYLDRHHMPAATRSRLTQAVRSAY